MNRSEIIEMMARAIYSGRNGIGATPWAHIPKAHRQPYLADATASLDAIEAAGAVVVPVEAINWLNGCGDDFEPRSEDAGRFWWRSEFMRRANIVTNRDGTVAASPYRKEPRR